MNVFMEFPNLHPLFMHFYLYPVLTELCKDGWQRCEQFLYIFLGILFAQRQAQTAVRFFNREAHGQQNMGGIDRAGGAGGAG
jgi:hypothetical protein